jgi:thiosulfate dehydrogenase [quinone] large subunit
VEKKDNHYSGLQLWMLVITRVLIGWYFLYEGVSKILNPNWSSYAFLLDSKGIFAPLFKSLASNAELLSVVDSLNEWGLTAIGLGLILGLFTKVAIVCGVIVTALFSLSHPSLIGVEYMLPATDNAMWIGKNIIFIFILILLYLFPTSTNVGIDRFFFRKK